MFNESDYKYQWLNNVANIVQLMSFELNLKQISNDDILQYLQHQDNDLFRICIEQNKKIISQNEEILKYLKSDRKES